MRVYRQIHGDKGFTIASPWVESLKDCQKPIYA